MSLLAGLAGSAFELMMKQPPAKQVLQDIDYVLGINETSRARWNFYRENWASTLYPRGRSGTYPANTYREPVRQGFSELLTGFNQSPLATSSPTTQRLIWETLRNNCRRQAIDISNDELPGPETAATRPGEFEALQWRRIIDMSAAAAPLGGVIRDYYRSLSYVGASRSVDEEELLYNLQRANLRRQQDRDRLMKPFLSWSIADIVSLRWMGVLSDDLAKDFYAAAGLTREEDMQLVTAMAVKRPDANTLQGWRSRLLWDESLAAKYGLDAIPSDSPVAQFFTQAQGVGRAADPLPGQPAGETNWLKLAYRAARPLPDFGMARTMQHRLRPIDAGNMMSVVPGSPAWTALETSEMLAIHGYPQPVIDRMMGLVDEPLNIRLINHVLAPMATHPEVVAAAARVFGPGYDWVKRALLDHGFNEGMSTVAQAGILAQADDRANAEKLEHEKRLRQDVRARAIADFELGTLSANDAADRMIDKFFTLEMATTELNVVQKTLNAEVVKVKIDSVHAAWMDGTKTAPQCSELLDQIGITENRRNQYLDEWAWQRIGKLKMLTTGEVLTALKNGLLTPQAAIVRLTNLGWHQPDALIEIAQVQQDLMIAQAKTQAATANKVAAEAHHAQLARAAAVKAADAEKVKEAHAKQQAEKAARAELAKEVANNAKIDREMALATHEKLLAQNDYYKAIHLSNAAYHAAAKKGDQEKMAAEVNRSLSLYQKYLIEQIKLISQGPEVANVVAPLDTTEAEHPQSSDGAAASDSRAGTSPAGTTGPAGKTSPPA